ncbi:DMT family transporter [Candidatus Woesearchaeota archaeon]|nr:DMT family transporter [Candidatus Woesearchaeota archaeon]
MKNSTKGIMYALLAVALWATLGVGFKLAVTSLDSFSATVFVGFFATLFLFLYLLISKKLFKIWSVFKLHPLFFIFTGIIGLGIQQILYLKGYSLLPASTTVIIFYLYPLLMILLSAIIYKEKTSLKSFLLVLFGFLGVIVLLSKGTLLKIDLSMGVLITFLASLSWALFSVLIKNKKFDVDVGMFFFNSFGLLSLLFAAPFFGLNFDVSVLSWVGLIYLGVFPTAIAFLLWNKALCLSKTSTCSNIALLTPPLSMVLIILILGEKLSVWQVIGFVIILTSVYLNVKVKN